MKKKRSKGWKEEGQKMRGKSRGTKEVERLRKRKKRIKGMEEIEKGKNVDEGKK